MIYKSLIFLFVLLISPLFGECDNQLFTISAKKKGVSGEDIINRLSEDCKFSVVIKDQQASEKLKKPLQNLYMRDVTIEEIFQLVLGENDLIYEFDGSKLKVSYLLTRTFEVDILSTTRTGTSSTNIAITGEKVSGGGGGSTQGVGGVESGGSSNAEITSNDGYSFWDETILLAELNGIVTRPEDDFSNVNIIVNKGAGLVTVTGNKRQVNRVKEYLDNINKRLKSQVLIDVNILTVKHSNSKSIGIDWSSLTSNIKTSTVNSAFGLEKTKELGSYTTDTRNYTKNLGFGIPEGTSLSVSQIVDFLKGYGEVSTVSNPKVMTLNNQPSLISVGNIFYYKEVTVTDTGDTTNLRTTEDITYTPLFVGILLDITPSIYNDEIMLKINPSITKTTKGDIDKTGTAFTEGPPNLESKQLSSVVKIRDGQRVVLGGLISRDRQEDEKKVPFLGDMPLIGYAFKREEMYDQLSEMVIVITPHVVKNSEVSLKDLGYTKDNLDAMMKVDSTDE